MLTKEQLEFIKTHHLRKLTNSIPEEESLYDTLWGARTVASAMEMHNLALNLRKKNEEAAKQIEAANQKRTARLAKLPQAMLMRMEAQNQKCIDEHGCALYTFW
jgi:hypothetical protein